MRSNTVFGDSESDPVQVPHHQRKRRKAKSLNKNSKEWLILIGALVGILIVCLVAFYTTPKYPCLDCSSAEAYAYSRGKIIQYLFSSRSATRGDDYDALFDSSADTGTAKERKQIVRLLYSRSHVDNVQFHGWDAEKLFRYAEAYAQ